MRIRYRTWLPVAAAGCFYTLFWVLSLLHVACMGVSFPEVWSFKFCSCNVQKLLIALESLDLSFNYIEELEHLVVSGSGYLTFNRACSEGVVQFPFIERWLCSEVFFTWEGGCGWLLWIMRISLCFHDCLHPEVWGWVGLLYAILSPPKVSSWGHTPSICHVQDLRGHFGRGQFGFEVHKAICPLFRGFLLWYSTIIHMLVEAVGLHSEGIGHLPTYAILYLHV